MVAEQNAMAQQREQGKSRAEEVAGKEGDWERPGSRDSDPPRTRSTSPAWSTFAGEQSGASQSRAFIEERVPHPQGHFSTK